MRTLSGPARGKVSSLREQHGIGFRATVWGRERSHSLVTPVGSELCWGVAGRGEEAGVPNTWPLTVGQRRTEMNGGVEGRGGFFEIHPCDKGSRMGQSTCRS